MNKVRGLDLYVYGIRLIGLISFKDFDLLISCRNLQNNLIEHIQFLYDMLDISKFQINNHAKQPLLVFSHNLSRIELSEALYMCSASNAISSECSAITKCCGCFGKTFMWRRLFGSLYSFCNYIDMLDDSRGG